MTKTALIIGVTGGIGHAAALALRAHGWTIRALHREPESAAARFPGLQDVDWTKGDALEASDVNGAARDASVVVHAANPPNYKNWRGLAVPMLANAIDAAKAHRARLVFPGNVYNFDPARSPVIDEASPQVPRSRKGAIRVEMETMLQGAVADGARVLIVRAGDFFGPNAPGSWLSNVMVKPGKTVASVVYPGTRDVGHAWAYLPDVAETIAQLLEREAELATFDVFHFGGHYVARGVEIADAVRKAAGVPNARIRKLPWVVLYAASPFVPLFRELIEMRYLWREPLRLDNRKLVGFLGSEPHTPLDEALADTLRALGCST
jgi:nucleoside-diphosphate-sugar epimerase